MSRAATAMEHGWSISIGTVKGTVVRLHVTFLLFLLWIGMTSWLAAGPAVALNTLILLVLLFLCVVLHEFGHILAARRFGVRTPEVLLLPIGGLSRLERIPEQPGAEFVIAIAGPAVTLAIALGLILLLGGLPDPQAALSGHGIRAIAARLAYVNLGLFAFNLLPAFPMDGGRVLRALLSAWLGHDRGTRIAAGIGQAVAVLLGLVGIAIGHVILILIAIFVYLAASSETGLAQLRGFASGVPAGQSMITNFVSLRGESPVSDAVRALLSTEQREFPVLDDTGRLRGMLTRDGIIRALSEEGPDTPIARVMHSTIPSVSGGSRMDDVVPLLAEGAPAVAVTDEEGRFVGYITLENLMEELLISKALNRRAARRAADSRGTSDDR